MKYSEMTDEQKDAQADIDNAEVDARQAAWEAREEKMSLGQLMISLLAEAELDADLALSNDTIDLSDGSNEDLMQRWARLGFVEYVEDVGPLRNSGYVRTPTGTALLNTILGEEVFGDPWPLINKTHEDWELNPPKRGLKKASKGTT